MPSPRSDLSKRLETFSWFAMGLIILSFVFFSNLQYKQTLLDYPSTWKDLLAGRGPAPDQYRVGVIFLAGYLNKASHGHLSLRYCLTLLDLGFMTVAISAMYAVLVGGRYYRAAGPTIRAAILALTLLMLLYYLPWTLWYQKPEIISNFASLALASLLLSGRFKSSPLVIGAGLLLITAFLAITRADSGFALSSGLLLATLLPGAPCLPFSRMTQAVIASVGIATDLGIEFYIKHFVYPRNPFIYPIIQIHGNVTSGLNIFCFVIALAPFLFFLYFAKREWAFMEGWERVLIAASLIELAMFIVIALIDEVRLFLPYPMALLPSSAVLLCRRLLGSAEQKESPEWSSTVA